MTITSSASPTSGLVGSDLLGSAIQKLSVSGLRRISYTPFGHAANLQSGSVGFTGQVKEPGTAQYMLGNGYRGYSPSLLRFTAADNLSPFGKGGLNSYSYCLGQPVTRIDPNGQFSLLLAFGALAGLVGTGALIGGSLIHEKSPSDLSKGLMIGGAVLGAFAVGAVGVKVLGITPRFSPQRIVGRYNRQLNTMFKSKKLNFSSPNRADRSRGTYEMQEATASIRRGG